MGLVSKCKSMAKEAVKDAVAKAQASTAPPDPEAYAAKVAETIKADVRYAIRYGRGANFRYMARPQLAHFVLSVVLPIDHEYGPLLPVFDPFGCLENRFGRRHTYF